MSAAKKLPDAVLSCLYRWMQHNGELDKLTLQAAIKQTVPETPEGATVRRLESMRGNYDAMFDAGYFNALKGERVVDRRTNADLKAFLAKKQEGSRVNNVVLNNTSNLTVNQEGNAGDAEQPDFTGVMRAWEERMEVRMQSMINEMLRDGGVLSR